MGRPPSRRILRSWILRFWILCLGFPAVQGAIRRYFMGITEETWNYAPTGDDLLSVEEPEKIQHAFTFLKPGPHRIGSVYKKAVYKQFRDARYLEEVAKPAWLGFLGPVLKAEVGDVIIVHLKNFASRSYSLHPHGVFYDKDSEGALYPDGTSGELKHDDRVPPGGNHTYTWTVKPQFAPTAGDPNCLTWAYHSHVDAPRDIASGLLGAILTCRKGVLRHKPQAHAQLERVDVDHDFLLLFSVMDENLSWYLEENIQAFCSEPMEVDPEDEDFKESNQMHAINGYLYGNLPALEMCVNRTVSWHLLGMGNEVDVHSVHFHGHTVLNLGHRADVLSLFPAIFVTAEMITQTAGRWMLSCEVNDHIEAGMQAFYNVLSCGKDDHQVPPSGRERQYFIAAEEILWDYGPLNINPFLNLSLNDPESQSEVYFGKSNGRLGGIYWKAHFVEYTDSTFTRKHRSSHGTENHLGILGPVIRAEVGDVLKVVFMNNASWPYSMQPHGLQFDPMYEGTRYRKDTIHGSSVSPGQRFTYKWKVLEGPSANDPPCISYLYYSATDAIQDTSSGLVGPLLVCKKGWLGDDDLQMGISKEFFLLFSVIDENQSRYLHRNIHEFGSGNTDIMDEDFEESNLMHAVNGYMYGNLPGLDMCAGKPVTWHVLGLGSEADIHGVYFQGNSFQREGTTRDTLSVFPHTSVTVLMEPHMEGTFEVSCRTSDHYRAGMQHHYTVRRCSGGQARTDSTPTSMVRYFIAAEEVEWDYSPSRDWELEKHMATEESSPGNMFVQRTENWIGSKYKKVVFREYTDATYRTRKERQLQEQHLEILGPIIQAEVGERLLVSFKNKASRPFSMHAHGVQTDPTPPPPVKPGQTKQYKWDIPEQSGPGFSDPNCISFAYYSAADFVKDMASGLIGPLVICRRGTLDEARRRKDVDREFALLFMVFDENESWYLEDNVKTYLGRNLYGISLDEDFQESNKMHGINGKLYGNLHGLTMLEGERTDWYLLGMGNEVDVHTVHFHAESFTYKSDTTHRADVYDLFPGTFQTVELVALNPGTWLLHCHVTDHIHAGMETTFTILNRRGTGRNPMLNGTPTPRLGGTATAPWTLIAFTLLVSTLSCEAAF
ncbi:ferroxidase HEPHL1-like isoform X2 [Brienomyrus brachyistius]|uniref:ferroxidase HEPHL1-like isoform X2 n=1 Tax=Brienomyrus brachyistius TaxID=42636 RepID=UPI0020B1E3A6|nr:ferroxidase HEPHL1-like isoform X2 [Brienomyrus brachyistius]